MRHGCSSDAEVVAAARDLERHVRALDADDSGAMTKGAVAAFSVLVVAVLVLGWLFAR